MHHVTEAGWKIDVDQPGTFLLQRDCRLHGNQYLFRLD